MKVALDTNVLFYALDAGDDRKHALARDVIERAERADCVLPLQVLGELLSAVGRRQKVMLPVAEELVAIWLQLFAIAPTRPDDLATASRMVRAHKLQFWDALIMAIAARAGASILLTEDMHAGLTIDGLTLVNPFDPANHATLDALLTPAPGTA